MKRKILFFIVVLAVSIFFVPNVYAADVEAKIGDISYETLEKAYEAAVDGDEIVLQDNVTLEETLKVSKDITINMNNFNIEKDSNVINVDGGSLTITGTGTIRETSPDNAGIKLYGSTDSNVTNYTYLNVGENVTIEAWSPVMISVKSGVAYGVSADISGTLIGKKNRANDLSNCLYINGQIKHKTNYPVINVTSNATITSEGTGVYIAGYAEVNIDAATITGTEAGIAVKSGVLNLTNATVTATGSYSDPSSNNNGVNGVGAAIQIESNTGYAGDIKINVNGGTYESVNNSAIVEYISDDTTTESSVKEISISAGTFTAKDGMDVITASDEFKETNTGFITGGTYSSSVKDYLADGLTEGTSNNNYRVEQVNTAPNTNDVSNPETADINIIAVIVTLLVGITGIGYTIKKRRFS